MTRAPFPSACASIRSPYHEGTNDERVRVGVLDPRALDERVEVVDVDELRAAVVRRGGERPRQILLAELGA